MLTWITDWLRRRRDDRAAAKAGAEREEEAFVLALAASESSDPEWQPWCRHRIDAEGDGYIVTLLQPSGRPPRRSWWHVDKTGTVIELPYDEVVMRIHIPGWR